MEEQLVKLFSYYLTGWSWEEWQAAGTSDKEDVAVNAIAELGPNVDIEAAYDVFYDWAAGLTEADFGSNLEEAGNFMNKTVKWYADHPTYSGSFSGLNNMVASSPSAAELEKKRQEAEERKAKAAADAAERAAKREEQRQQAAIRRAEKAIADDKIDEYHLNWWPVIYRDSTESFPIIDPETKEIVTDPVKRRSIIYDIYLHVTAAKDAKKAAAREKAAQTRARNKADAEAAEAEAAEGSVQAQEDIKYKLAAEVVIAGESHRSKWTKAVDKDGLVIAAKDLARKEVAWVNDERKFYRLERREFNWDGKITIWCKESTGNEYIFREFRVHTNEALDEAIKVVSDPDALYHYTTPLPFCRILRANALKTTVHGNAVCFTTDNKYRIFGNTCGFQLSRKKMIEAGYELEEYDDALAFDPDWEEEHGESEERVYEDVTKLRDLLTAVHIHWSPEGMTQDIAPDSTEASFIEVAQSEKGDYIGDEDIANKKDLVWKIPMNYFRRQLDALKARGIKVYEYGTPMDGIYWLDRKGKLQFGSMPGTELPLEEPVPEVEPEPVLASSQAEASVDGDLLTEDSSEETLYWEFFGNDDDLGCSYCCPKCGFQTSEESFWSSDFQTFKPFTECPECGTKLKA